MKKRDEVTAICWMILGFIISIWSSTFPFGRWDALGPAALPFTCGLILILLGSILFFQVRKKSEERPRETITPIIPHGAGLTRVVLSIGGMLLSAVLFQFLGYIITLFFLVLLLIRANEPERWKADIFYTLVFTLGSYMVFQVLLKTPLPTGFLGF
jgi:hypothetical protein